MAFASDNFTRANGALGATWTPIENTPPVILSNGFTNGTGTSDNNSPNSSTNAGSAYWNAALFPPNQFSQVIVQNVGATGTDCAPGCIVRGSSSGTIGSQNWYALIAGPNTTGSFPNYCIELWKLVGGVATFLAQAPFAPTIVNGDVLRLEVFGTQLCAYYNGTLVAAVTDSSISSGQPGITLFLGSPVIDHPATTTQGGSWSAGDLNNVLVIDNFIRADANPLSGSWSTVAGIAPLQISSHLVVPTGTNVNGYELYNGVTWPNDQWAQTAFWTSDNSTTFEGVVLRGTTASETAYAGFASVHLASTGTWFIIKYLSGVQTVLASGTFATNQGDVLYLEVKGTTLKLKRNGVQILTATDNSIASGSAGLFIQSNAAAGISSFTGGKFPVPSASATQIGAFSVGF